MKFEKDLKLPPYWDTDWHTMNVDTWWAWLLSFAGAGVALCLLILVFFLVKRPAKSAITNIKKALCRFLCKSNYPPR